MIKIFKRLSDNQKRSIESAIFDDKMTNDSLFQQLFGALEAYDVATIDNWPGNLKSYDVVNGSFSAVQFTQDEINAFPHNVKKANINADKAAFESHPFKDLTPDQVDAWVDANFLLLDLATTKDTFKKIIKALIYLIRRSDLK